MLISMNWISDFVDLTGVNLRELINRFTLSTAEVEEIYEKGADVENVVAARILSVEAHPNSKKLHVLQIDAGGEPIPCVCGAPNVREGMMTAFARSGGMVGGQRIAPCMLAGIESRGMCCSEKELGISEEHAGIMELPPDTVPGTPIEKIIPLRDVVFEVDNKSLTNRPDLWGHYGLAREFAALLGRPLKPVPQMDLTAYDALPAVDIRVESDLCFRYTAITAENITRRVSPIAMRVRLYYCGMRPINLLADLTNYLMLELGQPMHAFDHAAVRQIAVRPFDEPVDFVTLDNVTRHIAPGTLMICGGDPPEPVAVAGIMGGFASEIKDNTTSVLLESANFDGVSVRKTSAALGLRTEASARYEKMLDPELTDVAVKRFMHLLLVCDPGAKVTSALTDVYRRHYDPVNLRINEAYIDRYAGIHIPGERVENTLSSLGFGVFRSGGDFSVSVPTFRATKDVTIPADLVEEVTRILGYDNIPPRTAQDALRPVRQSAAHEAEYQIKLLLAERFSLSEIHSYIWYNRQLNRELNLETKDNIAIVNSVSPDCSVIRSCMAPSLLCAVYENKALCLNGPLGIFEIGRVAEGLDPQGLCIERKRLGIALAQRNATDRELYYRVLEMISTLAARFCGQPFAFQPDDGPFESWMHPKNTARAFIDGEAAGYVSVLHPAVRDQIDKKLSVVTAEIDLERLLASAPDPVAFEEISKYPGIDIDLSLLMNQETAYADVESSIRACGCAELTDVHFVDLYESETLAGSKSITIRLSFVSHTHTLSLEETAGFVNIIKERLEKQGVTLRGENHA